METQRTLRSSAPSQALASAARWATYKANPSRFKKKQSVAAMPNAKPVIPIEAKKVLSRNVARRFHISSA